jgi:acyl-[acyl-carrier-protein]-phospholipid O-acyltransferase/long-chain-fatty-acid--[acyl-carrier-protein] ligase
MFKPVVRLLLRVLFKLLFRLRIEGDLVGLDAKRLLIIANHESFLDGLLLGVALPLNPVFVVHTGVVKSPFFRLVLSLVDYLAVDPTNPMAMKSIVKLVESGRPVVIFPEGRITTTGSLMKVYDGPAFVAAKTGADVLPVRLDGPARSYFARTSGRYPKQFLPRIHLTVLPATRIALAESGSAKQRRRLAGEAMRRIMQDMVFSARPRQSLYAAFVDAVAIHGRRRPVMEDMKQIELTYGELLRMTLALGRVAARQTAEGETVGLLLPNLSATVALLFGLTSRRRIPAMLNYTAGAEGLANACTAARVRRVITSRRFVAMAKLDAVLASLVGNGDGIELIWLEDLADSIGIFDKLWVLVAQVFSHQAATPVSPEAPAVVLFTSGSEGKPKGVALSHRALLANIAQIRAVIDLSPEDKFLNALPMFHSFGLTGGTLLPLLSGASVFLYPSPLHYRVIPELAYDRNCTVLLGTGTFLANYARFAHPYDFYRLRHVIAGAEKLSEAVRATWFEKFGVRIMEGYGATETAPVIVVNTPMAYQSGSVGQLLPGIEAKLVPVPGIAEGGLLHVKGPNVMSGYYRVEKPGELEPLASEVGAGWYNTGDIVEIDAEGFLHIRGRVKRFAKIAGEMVSLEVVEKLGVTASPAFQHAASSRSDPQRGEAIILYTTDAGLNRERLLEAARAAGLPEITVPREIRVLEVLPLLGTGKIDHVTLKKMAEAP